VKIETRKHLSILNELDDPRMDFGFYYWVYQIPSCGFSFITN